MFEFTRPVTPCFGCDEDYESPVPLEEGSPGYSGTSQSETDEEI